MNEDIPLSIDLPAVALKLAQCRMSWLHVINDRFQCMGITGQANRERQESTLCGTRRALEVVRALPFNLGRVRRIGGSADYPNAGLGVNNSAGRPLTGAEEGVVGSGGEDHGQRE